MNYTVPKDVACAPRTLMALVEDSAGQTASSQLSLAVNPSDCAVQSSPPPPALAFLDPPLKISGVGRTIALRPVAAAGIRQVELFLGDRKVCTEYANHMVELANEYRDLLSARKKKGKD